MRLVKIIANNYKGFKSLELSLNKINILIGKNGSGKSTIARLIPLIMSSLQRKDLSPLNLSPFGIDIASRFEDLSHHQNDSSEVTLGASFSDDKNLFHFETGIRHFSEQGSMLVNSFHLSINKEKVIDLEIDLNSLEATRHQIQYNDLINKKKKN